MRSTHLSTSVIICTVLALTAFATNSLLCRAALMHTGIDAGSFTSIRLISGAVVLWLITRKRSDQNGLEMKGDWTSAAALFGYAACFSFAYLQLPTASGALILFSSVHATIISFGLMKGERLRFAQVLGLVIAFGGLVFLLLPGLSTPSPGGAVLMALAGMSWGVYSVRGKGVSDPIAATAGNFVRSIPFTVALSLVPSRFEPPASSGAGVWLAIASGVVASGGGYILWYSVLPSLTATTAATIQLSVPVLTAAGGILLLGETVTLRFLLCSSTILGGIALVTLTKRPSLTQRLSRDVSPREA